jgi:hypothetical protein
MFEFPRGRKKILSTIRRYERLLWKEQEETGVISDGYGKRYFLGIFYLLLGDTQGAMKSFEWFERTFEDDGSEPFHSLTWALTLYRNGRIEEASKKLRHTMLLNLYLIPHLFGMRHKNLDIWHASNWCEKSYLKDAPPEIFDLWDTEALDWARVEYDSVEFRETRARYIEIYRQLKKEPVGPRRFKLVAEAGRLEDGED